MTIFTYFFSLTIWTFNLLVMFRSVNILNQRFLHTTEEQNFFQFFLKKSWMLKKSVLYLHPDVRPAPAESSRVETQQRQVVERSVHSIFIFFPILNFFQFFLIKFLLIFCYKYLIIKYLLLYNNLNIFTQPFVPSLRLQYELRANTIGSHFESNRNNTGSIHTRPY